MGRSTEHRMKAASESRRDAATNVGLIEIQIQYRDVADLALDSRNPRQHSQKQVNQIADSIREFGFVMPIVIDDRANVVIGHGRLLAARKLAMPRVPVVEIRHLSPAQLKALRIADNRLAENAHWDDRFLGENFLELKGLEIDFDLSITGFSLPEIDLAIQRLDDELFVGPNEEVDAIVGVPVCRPGDVWLLGDHRIHCGEATSEAAFECLMNGERARVVFIDPPYTSPVDGHRSGKEKVHGGELARSSNESGREEFESLLRSSCALLAKNSESGAIHFVCADWRHADQVLAAGRNVYSQLINIVVWVKSNAGMGSLYRSQHELIFVFKSGTGQHTNKNELNGCRRNRSNVWNYPNASSKARKRNKLESPPTAKPVQLVIDALLDCSERGEVVLDSFLGSGTTLLAAERTGRICRGIELDPLGVDTAIRRWQNRTGRDAVRLADNKSFREIESEKEQSDE